MSQTFSFPDLLSNVENEEQRDVAIVGADVASAVTAFMLSCRGHRVVWYRGKDCNPHPVSGVLRIFAAEPMALPGYLLSIPRILLSNAVRGGLQGSFSRKFASWLLSSVAFSRPLVAEAIAADRARLLSEAESAFHALAKAMPMTFGQVDVVTLYKGAPAYAMGWAGHDVQKRYGQSCEEINFDAIAAQFPHLSPMYTHGIRIAGVPKVQDADSIFEAMKAELEGKAEIVRHWPQRIKAVDPFTVEILDNETSRKFDWVIRGDDSGPDAIWPANQGAISEALVYRERHLLRQQLGQSEVGHEHDVVVVDGASSAWMEHDADFVIAAGAHRCGGDEAEDMKYLVSASYVRLWRELAGRDWQAEGGRLTTSKGCVTSDSRPILGHAGHRILESAGFGCLAWTLSAIAGYAMLAHVEGRDDEIKKYAAFSPRRFL